MDFKVFRDSIADRFHEISKDESHVFEVDVDKDEFWEFYLDSYPAGDK